MDYGTGAKFEEPKPSNFVYEALGTSPLTEEDWKNGFDIEKKINFKIPIKNQQSTYSCVGQAFSYYGGVLEAIETGVYKTMSAKAIYSMITLGRNQGAYLSDGAKLVVSFGLLLEELVKSYKADGKTDEEFMIDKSWANSQLIHLAEQFKSSDYYSVTGLGIDYFAKAIRDGNGMVAGIKGINNGSWSSNEPKPPQVSDNYYSLWGHALFFGKFGIDKKGKYIATPNSWGVRPTDDDHIDGWQKLRENYFINNNLFVFNPWVLIDRKNDMANNNVKVIKDKNSSAVGFWLPAISEDVLKSLALNFGIDVKYKADGKIDWDKMIQGELVIK